MDVRLNRYKDLVILHSDPSASSLPRNTRRWLQDRQLRSHHHVRREVKADYSRLARFLAGESIGVVLGGGGARGLAHVGVLQALDEEGIPIDCIGGCSQGAFIAALYAKHLSATTVVDVASEYARQFSTMGFVRDLTLPILSYFNGANFSRVVREALGADLMIEDLWLSFFCISTNVRRSDINVHRSGLLWRYCRASMTLLGFLPPVIDDNGDLLLDGGYANNLPVDVMASPPSHARTIIAVDVEDKDLSVFDGLQHLARRRDLGMSISGLWLLWNKLFSRVRVPDFRSILIYLSCLNHSRQLRQASERRIIDLYIRPPIEGIGLLDYLRYEEVLERGRKEGRRAVREWKRAMWKVEEEAEERGEDYNEVRVVQEEKAEVKAQEDIRDRLRRSGREGAAPLPPRSERREKPTLARAAAAAAVKLKPDAEERKEAAVPKFDDGEEDKEADHDDDDDGDEDEEEEDAGALPPSVSSSSLASPPASSRGFMTRAVSAPSMDALPASKQLSSFTSSSSQHSISPSVAASSRPPLFTRNPSMRMLRSLPLSHSLARGDTKGIRGVLKRKDSASGEPRTGSSGGLKVAWSSDTSVRAPETPADGETAAEDGQLHARLSRSSSLPQQ